MPRVTLGRSVLERIGTIGLATATLAALVGLGVGPARAEEPLTCGPGEISGIPTADAETAVRLVCDAIRRESGGRGQYEVSLGTLGRLVILSVARREPPAPRRSASTASRRSRSRRRAWRARWPANRPARGGQPERPRGDRGRGAARGARAGRRRSVRGDAARRQPPRDRDPQAPGEAGLRQVLRGDRGRRDAGLRRSRHRLLARPSVRQTRGSRCLSTCGSGSTIRRPASPRSTSSRSAWAVATTSKRDVSPFFGAGLGMVWLHASSQYHYSETRDGGYFYADHLGVTPYVEVGVEAV